MRYLSLFSGIEAASTAWEPLGWQCAGFSEIEPGPCRLLAKRYPNVPNLGDVTKITELDIAMLGPLDLLVFGSPCQDLSVAGKQKGLSGARSGLFLTAINIVRWARVHCGLRWALWENVPGAFTSNKGADFAVVVAMLGGGPEPLPVPAKTKDWKGGWGNEGCYLGTEAMVEWSTLDAQWFGVAQRRRRVFALADFGDWAGRPPVLLEPEGMRGDSAPRRGTQEDAPPRAAGGAGTHGAGPVVATLDANYGRLQGCSGQDLNHGHSHIVVDAATGFAFGGNNTSGAIDVAPALLAKGGSGHGDFETETFVVQGAAGSVQSHHNMVGTLTTNCDRVSGSAPAVVYVAGERTHALTAEGFDASEDGTGRGNPIVALAFDCKSSGQNGFGVGIEVAGTQRAMGHSNSHTNGGGHQAVLVAYTTKLHNTRSNNAGKLFEERTPCLDANSPAPALLGVGRPRRLTPLECERLQAFPDHHTALIGAADGPRYKALGNSMCVNVMRWIGHKVDFVHEFC